MEITIEEMKQLACGQNEPQPDDAPTTAIKRLGKQIVVLDRGFVYVGETSIQGDYVHINDARCIRYWGTSKGLGELRNGPTDSTKIDDVGDVMAPLKALIHFIKCQKNW